MGIGPGNIANQIPMRADDPQRKARDLARLQREQAAAKSGQAMQVGAGGILINGGGSLTIAAPGTLNVAGGALNSAGSITAGTSINAGTSIEAGTSVTADGALSAGTTITAGSTISTPGNVSGGGLISTGSASIATGLGVGGNMSAGGQITATAALSSPGAYGLDVSTLPGARQQVWQHNSGPYGFAPSTVDAKTNIGAVTFTAADVLAVSPHVYQYKAQIAIREDASNAFYDADYVVPWEIGLLAEDLIAHNMSCFVVYEADGVTAKTINYDLFAAVATLVLAQDFDARLKALETASGS